MTDEQKIALILYQVRNELVKAMAKHGPMRSRHEGYAILKEEFDEFWDEIKRNDGQKAREEVLQIGAMAVRYLLDIKD